MEWERRMQGKDEEDEMKKRKKDEFLPPQNIFYCLDVRVKEVDSSLSLR